MPEQNNTTNSIAQDKYPWGIKKIKLITANSLNRLPNGGRFFTENCD